MSEEHYKFVIPGDQLSYAEEYLPGDNASEVGYRIISSSFGELKTNHKDLVISVERKKDNVVIENNDIVYGQITKSDSRQISVSVVGVLKKKIVHHVTAEGHLRLHQERRDDTRNFKPVMVGDLVRARVIRAGQFLELTLNGNDLGVLKSRCSNCREVLVLKEGSLFCNNCRQNEGRKVAPDYGCPIFEER